jgi:carbonic anhydrase
MLDTGEACSVYCDHIAGVLEGPMRIIPESEDIDMRVLSHLFANNRAWAAERTREDPDFFRRLSRQQAPQYLWIGCSDSRVPANQIVGLLPGEMFVHRNVANVVVHADLNCLSTIQFAVEVLRVGHVIVCGHYGCAGVLAALRDEKLGLVDNWLRHVQDVRWKHRAQLDALDTEAERHTRLCELNVIEQVVNVSQTTVVRGAWARGQAVAVHGWIYGLQDGLLRDLGMCVTGEAELHASPQTARQAP